MDRISQTILGLLESNKKIFFFIFLICLIVYFPTLFNGFVWDDLVFIINNPQVHEINIPALFGQNLFNSGPFYRPIPATYFAIHYTLFKEQAFYYHVSQLLLHTTSTYLVFVLLRRILKPQISLFLSLVFLVHPIQVESVAFFSASELFFLPGIAALILAQKKDLSLFRLLTIIVLLGLSVFTKETGALFFPLVIIYRYLFRLGRVRTFLLAAVLLAVFYVSMRLVAVGGITLSQNATVSIASLPFPLRLIIIPAVFVYYLKTFIFPATLIIWQEWVITSATFTSFFIPLFISIVFILSLSAFAVFSRRKASTKATLSRDKFHNRQEWDEYLAKVEFLQNQFRYFIFFLFWFVIGMGLIMQFIPLDMTVADRWFYFPIVGLLGIIGIGVQLFLSLQKRDYMKVYLATSIIILTLFFIRSFVRSLDYKDNLTLYGHDVRIPESAKNYTLMNAYATELSKVGRTDEAIKYVKKSIEIFPSSRNINNLGRLYQEKRMYDDALEAYSRSIELFESENYDPKYYKIETAMPPYLNKSRILSILYPEEGVDFIKNQALKRFPKDPELYIDLAHAYVKLRNKNEALKAAEQARKLAPENQEATTLYEQIRNINSNL